MAACQMRSAVTSHRYIASSHAAGFDIVQGCGGGGRGGGWERDIDPVFSQYLGITKPGGVSRI